MASGTTRNLPAFGLRAPASDAQSTSPLIHPDAAEVIVEAQFKSFLTTYSMLQAQLTDGTKQRLLKNCTDNFACSKRPSQELQELFSQEPSLLIFDNTSNHTTISRFVGKTHLIEIENENEDGNIDPTTRRSSDATIRNTTIDENAHICNGDVNGIKDGGVSLATDEEDDASISWDDYIAGRDAESSLDEFDNANQSITSEIRDEAIAEKESLPKGWEVQIVAYEAEIKAREDKLHQIVDDIIDILNERGAVNRKCGWCVSLKDTILSAVFPGIPIH
ncbi:uncharacterized protein KY384_004308 [Bacidia gigantensis]|uniref:uncharacterized protein n=1 Tax=Bacidia gigantensis TaxID=2732470 RepID=UPI001D0555BE|nr:uncharacterized protein KY384_004308 [Bacidia gigantensis]KAG8530951.1 hypothetical protein KY384_004308 [Bacidia gigantensis]